MTPRWQPILAGLAVLASTVASGTLECEPTLENRQLAHGRELYGRMCSVCHGADGEGYKADQAPALANQAFLRSASDPFLAAAITHGRAGSTMSAWGVEHSGPLAPAEVDAVVAFLRTWQVGPATPLDERPLQSDAVRGQDIFTVQCQGCHGAKGVGGKFESIGNPQLLSTTTNGFLRLAIKGGRDKTMMKAFKDTLADESIDDLVAALRTWQSSAPIETRRLIVPAKPPPLPLGPVPLNPHGPEPQGFGASNGFTSADVVHAELVRGARMAILDARAASDYTGDHIAGAVSVPFFAPEPYYDKLPKDAWLVCYCGCPHAESGQLAKKLRDKGFSKVTVIDQGLRYWESHHYATTKGTLP